MYKFIEKLHHVLPSVVRPQTERRLHERALAQWRKLGGGSKPVLLDSFTWKGLEDNRNHGFLIDARDENAPRLVHIGPVLRNEAAIPDEVVVRFEDLPSWSLLARLGRQFRDVVTSGEPAVASYEFVTSANYLVLSRGVLLPLSSDGERLDHVYGVISWKSESLAEAPLGSERSAS